MSKVAGRIGCDIDTMKSISIPILTCDLLGGPKIQLGGFFMKVKEEDLRRELLKAINGEDLIINCARRLGMQAVDRMCC